MRPVLKLNLTERPVPLRGVAIRVWREEAPAITEKAFIVSESNVRRSLRQERALCGRKGYDLNRHIRLLHQRRIAAVK